jgi:hypothetical protein
MIQIGGLSNGIIFMSAAFKCHCYSLKGFVPNPVSGLCGGTAACVFVWMAASKLPSVRVGTLLDFENLIGLD